MSKGISFNDLDETQGNRTRNSQTGHRHKKSVEAQKMAEHDYERRSSRQLRRMIVIAQISISAARHAAPTSTVVVRLTRCQRMRVVLLIFTRLPFGAVLRDDDLVENR